MVETRIAQAAQPNPNVRCNACTGPCGRIHTVPFVAQVRNKSQKFAQANSETWSHNWEGGRKWSQVTCTLAFRRRVALRPVQRIMHRREDNNVVKAGH
jgi:hypothetical protein